MRRRRRSSSLIQWSVGQPVYVEQAHDPGEVFAIAAVVAHILLAVGTAGGHGPDYRRYAAPVELASSIGWYGVSGDPVSLLTRVFSKG